MSATTKIEWADKTWNPIRARLTAKGRAHFGVTKQEKPGHFCVHVSEGCRNCYAERLQPYYGHGAKGSYRKSYLDQGLIEVYLDEKELLAPLKWRKPQRVFPCSMTDLFGEWVPRAWIDRIMAVIALTPHIDYPVLTKRAKGMREYMNDPVAHYSETPYRSKMIADAAGQDGGSVTFWEEHDGSTGNECKPWPLPNLHLYVSIEDQATAARLHDLMATPAAVRGVSYEPALGAVDFTFIPWKRSRDGSMWGIDVLRGVWCRDNNGIGEKIGIDVDVKPPWPEQAVRLDHVILGGESGPGARPMHPDWVRKVRDDCAAAKVPFFLKQWGEWAESHNESGSDLCLLLNGELRTFGAEPGAGAVNMRRVGKNAAGRLLDGREHNAMPGEG